MKKILGAVIGVVAIVAVIVALYIAFFRGKGIGAGSGDNNLLGVDQKAMEETTERNEAIIEPEEEPTTDEQEEKVPDNIIVEIVEDKVTINDESVANEEELREKINEYNNDTRTFELRETKSILSTYEWVAKTFDELEIYLKEQ